MADNTENKWKTSPYYERVFLGDYSKILNNDKD